MEGLSLGMPDNGTLEMFIFLVGHQQAPCQGPGPTKGLVSALEPSCPLFHYTVGGTQQTFCKGLGSKYFRLWMCLATI